MGGIAAFESRLIIEAAPLVRYIVVAAEPHTRLVRGRRADMKSRELIATWSGETG